MAGNVLEFSGATFDQEVLKSDKPVLVDFWAPWCGPCRMIAPMIDQIADEYVGSIKVGKVNTDENQDLAMSYQIDGIPTLLVFKQGEVYERFQGAPRKERLKDALDAIKG